MVNEIPQSTGNQTNVCTHPFTDAAVPPVMDDLDFLPEDAVAAPVSDLGAGFNSKYQQDDEGNKHQEAQDDCNGLQETHDSANSGEDKTKTRLSCLSKERWSKFDDLLKSCCFFQTLRIQLNLAKTESFLEAQL